MMDRRSFLGGVASMAAAAPPEGKKTRYYLIENYYLRHSTQLARINEFMSSGYLPAVGPGPKIFLEALVAPHMPQFMVVHGIESMEGYTELRAKVLANPEFRKTFIAWESGPEPPYEHMSQTLIRATDYSPEISLTPKAGRVFELRVYHSPTRKQLAALHQRFAGPEIKIFHRVGVHPILYGETVFGANMPNLTYLTPFDGLGAREKAWDTFGADPEWIKVRKESVDASGQIASVIQISLWRPTPYSPVR